MGGQKQNLPRKYESGKTRNKKYFYALDIFRFSWSYENIQPFALENTESSFRQHLFE
jgi:hypothetical protein